MDRRSHRRRPRSRAVARSPPVTRPVRRCVRKEVDLLSELPDDLLSHILSFLSVKEAVRNKLLSQRWKHLYPSSPTLKFRGYSYDRVDRIMQQFRAPKIKALELGKIHMLTDASIVDRWIHLACLMNVERITLHLHSRNLYMFPLHLLHISELRHLKHLYLRYCCLPPFTSLSSPITSLRTLSFDDCFRGNYEDIPSYFPYLESLSFFGLKQLPGSRHLCGQFYNLKSLRITFGSGHLEIHDVNLTNFRYMGYAKSFSFRSLNSLRSLDIVTFETKNVALILSILPEGAPQLKSLSISSHGKGEFRFPISISTFKYLKRLKLDLFDYNTDIRVMSKFLQVAPLLQILRIILIGESTLGSADSLEEQLMLPEMIHTHAHSQQEQHVCDACHLHSHLKEVEITHIDRRLMCFGRNDIELMVTLLKSATSLEKMVLRSPCLIKNMELLRSLALYKPQVKFSTDACEFYLNFRGRNK